MSKYARMVQEESEFGWKLHVDVHHQVQYYMHTYTGEIRWSVNVSQRNLKKTYERLSSSETTVAANAWPFLPQAVVMPSGPMVVQQPWNGRQVSLPYIGQEKSSRLLSQQVSRLVRRQALPPTWEQTSHGFPFLPPFHIFDYSMDIMQCTIPVVVQTTVATDTIPIKSHVQYQSTTRSGGSERIVKDGFMCTSPLSGFTHWSTSDGHRRYGEGIKKEHNRRGYMMRQAKKLMRQACPPTEEGYLL